MSTPGEIKRIPVLKEGGGVSGYEIETLSGGRSVPIDNPTNGDGYVAGSDEQSNGKIFFGFVIKAGSFSLKLFLGGRLAEQVAQKLKMAVEFVSPGAVKYVEEATQEAETVMVVVAEGARQVYSQQDVAPKVAPQAAASETTRSSRSDIVQAALPNDNFRPLLTSQPAAVSPVVVVSENLSGKKDDHGWQRPVVENGLSASGIPVFAADECLPSAEIFVGSTHVAEDHNNGRNLIKIADVDRSGDMFVFRPNGDVEHSIVSGTVITGDQKILMRDGRTSKTDTEDLGATAVADIEIGSQIHVGHGNKTDRSAAHADYRGWWTSDYPIPSLGSSDKVCAPAGRIIVEAIIRGRQDIAAPRNAVLSVVPSHVGTRVSGAVAISEAFLPSTAPNAYGNPLAAMAGAFSTSDNRAILSTHVDGVGRSEIAERVESVNDTEGGHDGHSGERHSQQGGGENGRNHRHRDRSVG